MIKKKNTPASIEGNDAPRRAYVETSAAPFCTNTTKNDVNTIANGLNFASQEIRTPVKPLPLTVYLLFKSRFVALTRRNPVIPAIIPQRINVRMITFLLLMPI